MATGAITYEQSTSSAPASPSDTVERIQQARNRISSLLHALEQIAEVQVEAASSRADDDVHLQFMETDRAQMAEKIDRLTFENQQLRKTSTLALQRVDEAISLVEQALAHEKP